MTHAMPQAAYPGLVRSGPLLAPKGLTPAWPCSEWGLPGRRITADAGGLLHHHFTLTLALCGHVSPPKRSAPDTTKGGLFLWPYPRVSPSGNYPALCPLERGLSSSVKTRDRAASLSLAMIKPGIKAVNGLQAQRQVSYGLLMPET